MGRFGFLASSLAFPPEDALLAGAVFSCTCQPTVPLPRLPGMGPDPYGRAEATEGHEVAWLGT